MSYEEAIQYLNSFHRFGIHLGLERINKLLQALENPHLRFPSVLIGGTNGKGSTARFLASIFQAQGYKVGLYTSPHLIDFRERIQINNLLISKKRVAELLNEIRSIIDQRQRKPSDIRHQTSAIDDFTYFEVATAIAFTYFSWEGVDLAVVEVGLGGRMDATNVLNPLVSAITNVSLEHQDYLGPTLSQIAFEKAGIIKERGILVTAIDDPTAWGVVGDVTRGLGARVYRFGRDFHGDRKTFDLGGQTFDFYGDLGEYRDLKIRLLGRHQVTNATLAVALAEILKRQGFRLDPGALAQGLQEAEWSGRLQVLQVKPLVFLDGAHNPEGARSLRLSLLEVLEGRRLFLVFGVLNDKDWEGMLAELGSLANYIVLTRPDTLRAAEPEKLYLSARKHCPGVVIKEKVSEAFAYVLSQASREDAICVTGSLYTVGEVLRDWRLEIRPEA